MSFDLDYSQVSDLSRRLRLAQTLAPKRMDIWLHEVVGPKLKTAMQDAAPVDTGNLKSKIILITEPGKIRVGTHGVPYTKYVVEGTAPHDIVPKTSSVLVFKVGGKTVYAKKVRHPGTKPNPFMKVSVERVIAESKSSLHGMVFSLRSGG
jgi:hypothetical protein